MLMLMSKSKSSLFHSGMKSHQANATRGDPWSQNREHVRACMYVTQKQSKMKINPSLSNWLYGEYRCENAAFNCIHVKTCKCHPYSSSHQPSSLIALQFGSKRATETPDCVRTLTALTACHASRMISIPVLAQYGCDLCPDKKCAFLVGLASPTPPLAYSARQLHFEFEFNWMQHFFVIPQTKPNWNETQNFSLHSVRC